jgi:hypothetical protein
LIKVSGAPTGTSERFAQFMEDAVLKYYREKELPVTISKIILDQQGKIQDRVETYYQDIQSYIPELIPADRIIFVAHSQGCPVTILLIKRLLDDEILHSKRQQISMLAMAGIHHGPLFSIKHNLVVKYFEADAARELFELNDQTSEISLLYKDALTTIISHIVLVCTGSWLDQVVPLHSALMTGYIHPNIQRLLFVEPQDSLPQVEFLLKLVIFAIMVLNSGYHDKHMLALIGESIIGNLISGNAHSTIYDEPSVYFTAVELFMNLSPSKKELKSISIPDFVHTKARNYYIPWVLNSLFRKHKREFNQVISDIQSAFDEWTPTIKPFKDLKYKLDPIKSKL